MTWGLGSGLSQFSAKIFHFPHIFPDAVESAVSFLLWFSTLTRAHLLQVKLPSPSFHLKKEHQVQPLAQDSMTTCPLEVPFRSMPLLIYTSHELDCDLLYHCAELTGSLKQHCGHLVLLYLHQQLYGIPSSLLHNVFIELLFCWHFPLSVSNKKLSINSFVLFWECSCLAVNYLSVSSQLSVLAVTVSQFLGEQKVDSCNFHL